MVFLLNIINSVEISQGYSLYVRRAIVCIIQKKYFRNIFLDYFLYMYTGDCNIFFPSRASLSFSLSLFLSVFLTFSFIYLEILSNLFVYNSALLLPDLYRCLLLYLGHKYSRHAMLRQHYV